MATMTINIPDAVANRVTNGVCARYGYQAVFEDGTPNPETKAQFAKRMVILFIKRAVREAEMEAAAKAAEVEAATDIPLS